MSLADEIRDYIYQYYILPARNAGKTTIIIRAGDIHREMNLKDRMPAACGAIGTNLFLETYIYR